MQGISKLLLLNKYFTECIIKNIIIYVNLQNI